MNDLKLFDDALADPDRNRIGKFHAPDAGSPETERESALFTYPRTGTARRRVLDFIYFGDGATDEELSIALRMRLYTAAPRRNELKNDGWIVDSGERRQTTTGASAAVWVMSDDGRKQWRPAE